ncbi:MAG: hypothetical protein Q9Q13_10920 [Acidobacteriota bacterium]|nr:hypothetical protein [Acidobacteriota bacterium]
MSRFSIPRGIVVCVLLTCAGLSLALAPHDGGSLADKVVRAAAGGDAVLADTDPRAATGPLDAFRREAGGQWWGRLEADSGRASLVSGSGLAAFDFGAAPPSLTDLETWARRLIADHPGLLAPPVGRLVLSTTRSMLIDGGRVAFIDFDWLVAGRRVQGARVFFRFNSGRLIQFGTRLLGGSIDSTEAVIDTDQAIAAMFDHAGGRTEVDEVFGEARSFFLPVAESGKLRHHLVWEVAFRRGGEAPTWTARVDARTGRVLEFFDANAYGRITGGVYGRTVVDEEVERPFPLAQTEGGSVTDRAGYDLYAGGPVASGLEGRFFRTECKDGCTNPPQDHAASDLGLGWLKLGLGGSDEVGNGVSTKAERNSFYHLNMIRLLAKKWLSLPWLDSTITTNVNINDTCNAFWNGSANFYRSGGGCNNTGEIADVMQHEWGHGLDGNTLGGDSATGEGTADHVAFIYQRDPVIGPYFRTSGAGVRNVDKETTSKGLMTRSNASQKCGTGSCSGPLGLECHCEGEIYGQAGWDLGQALAAKHGYHTGWQEFERIFFASLPQSGTYLPNQADSIYDAYLAVDDDDGNLANGTPNGQEIFDAFDLHEIAGDPVVSSPYCSRPAEPVVTITDGCNGVTLSWDAVAGAVEYNVLRNPLNDRLALLPLATVSGTSYTDTQALPGYTYHYVVEAVDSASCRSTIENVQTATGPQRPLLGIVDLRTDDVPAGNRSGTVDPGEAVDLFLTLEDLSTTAGTAVSGTIATGTPGVTVDIATDTFPDIPGLGSAENDNGFRFSLDDTVACGSDVDFTFTASDATGCPVDTQYFKIRVGVDEERQADTFETDQGWIFDAASSTATTGDWTRGVPDATGFQPGSDSDDAGGSCWFTAPNGGGDGGDDVDDGEVVLLSPVFDLSALSQATLSYQRWYANRDLGDDPGDFFRVEASDDGGVTWQLVEWLDDNVTAPAWTRVSFDLGSIITLTDQVRVRVRVADGIDTGSIVEGAFDDFRITEAVCDTTPPCFTPPSFDGLDQALAGPDCAENTLSWQAATTHCQNAEITYNVYRSTSPNFTPGPGTLVASGLTSLSYLDTLLVPGQDYHYVVRAYDSRSGEEDNLVYRSAAAPTTPDTKPPLFDGLTRVVSGAGCGEADLEWAAARETCSTPVVYRVYRSPTAGFTPGPANLVAQTTETNLVDAGLQPETDYYYVVRAVDQADLEDGNGVEKTAAATRSLPEVRLQPENFRGPEPRAGPALGLARTKRRHHRHCGAR